MRHFLPALLFSATALACSEKTEVKPEPAPPSSASAGSLATPVAPSSAEARPVDRSPIAVTEAKERLALSATRFDVEAFVERTLAQYEMTDRQLLVHPLRGGMLASYGGFVAALQDHRLVLDKALSWWPEECYEVTAIVGAWPKAMAAQVEFDSWKSAGYQRQAPIRETRHYEVLDGEWRIVAKGAGTRGAAWRDDSILGLQGSALGVLTSYGTLGKPPTQAAPLDAGRCKESPAEIVPEALDALPGGEAFIVGKHCGDGAYAVERWADEPGASVIEELPDAPKAAKRAFFSAAARDKAYAVLSTGDKVYAARWDGQAFRKVELQAEGDVRAVWTAADGTLFFVLQLRSSTPKQAKAELLRLTTGGELRRSAHFSASPSAKVWASDAETAYVSSYGSILSTRSGLVLVKPAEKAKEQAPASPPPSSGLPPFAEGCASPFVFLYDISAKSPPGYDFPSTRKALSTFTRIADISLIEFVHASKRRLGVLVPSAEVGRDVIAHVKANMKDEHPELVCLAPGEGVRTIAIR